MTTPGAWTFLQALTFGTGAGDALKLAFIDQVEVGRHVAGQFRLALQVDDSSAMTDRLTRASAPVPG